MTSFCYPSWNSTAATASPAIKFSLSPSWRRSWSVGRPKGALIYRVDENCLCMPNFFGFFFLRNTGCLPFFWPCSLDRASGPSLSVLLDSFDLSIAPALILCACWNCFARAASWPTSSPTLWIVSRFPSKPSSSSAGSSCPS